MDRTVMTSLGEVQVLERLRVRTQDLYPELVEEYVEALREAAVLPPVQVARLADRLVLIDGRHRIAAWLALDMPVSAELVGECSEAEALALALAANMRHGMRRNQGDVARCIHLALAMWPGSSNREIARRVGCSHTRVNQVVAEALPVERTFHSKAPEGSDVELGSAPAWRSPWTPESFQVVEPQDIGFADRMTEFWGEEPEARGEFATVDQTTTSSVEVARVFVDEAPSPEAAWVEGVDQELAGIGPGRVLLASGEAEVPVAREVKRHRGQDPLERWYTPEAMAAVCWRWLLGSGLLVNPMPKQPWVLRLLEPCVGGGAWLTGLEVASVQRHEVAPARAWTICDLDPEAPGLKLWRQRTEEAVVGDVTTLDFFGGGFDVAISNPPNSRALDVIMACLEVVRPGGLVVMLMPANWMAAKRRRAWLKMYPPEVVAWAPWRPSFEGPAAELQETDGGSPPQEYALHVWRVGAAPGVRWTGTWVEDFGSEEVGDGEE